MLYGDVAQSHILHFLSWDARDGATRITGVGHPDVLYRHAADAALFRCGDFFTVGFAAVAEAYEDRHLGTIDSDIADMHVGDACPVDALYGDGRDAVAPAVIHLFGFARLHGAVSEHDIVEVAQRLCTYLQCITVAAHGAVFHHDVLAWFQDDVLQADAVVIRIHGDAAHLYVSAAVEVESVVAVVAVIIYGDVLDSQVFAVIVKLHPHGCVAHGHATDCHPLAGIESDEHRSRDAQGVAGSVGESLPLSVDGTLARDADIVGMTCQDELRTDHHPRLTLGDDIVGRIFAAQQHCALLQV